jgi:predicted CXXCH cytochrome family protein
MRAMGRRSPRAFVIVALVACAAAGLAGARWKRRAVAADLATTRDLHGGGFAGSAACRRCHPEHHDSWSRTFHRTMTTEGTPANIRGDFSGATLRHAGVEARMDRDAAGGYRMTFATPGAPPRTAEVVRAVGSRRYQQYLTRIGDTYWRLPVAYHLEEKRWFPMTGAFLFADGTKIEDPTRPVFGGGVFDRHVTRWNDNCVFCHNVAPNPGRDPATGAFATTVAELGIACEACHGPGEEHARANADPVRRYALHMGGRADPTIVNPSRLSPERSAEVCGRCHGQRITSDVAPFMAHGDPFVAGDDLARYSRPLAHDTALRGDATAFAARFWSDGTPRLTAYEYQGLLQSKCAQRGGLTCTSCHGMHEGDPRGQIRARFAGDASDRMCTQCHAALAAPAALKEHAHHDPAGEGARCVGCHMPRIVYGVLDIHRSHRIDSPKPGVPGRHPEACSLCHLAGVGDRPGAMAIFSADPVMRAVYADAFGSAPAFSKDERASRMSGLLDLMVNDNFPAVRDLAWRGVRRLAAPDARPGTGPAFDFDPSGDQASREAVARRVSADLIPGARPPSKGSIAAFFVFDPSPDLEMGE